MTSATTPALASPALGFGCAPILGRVGERESVAALDHAYARGVRHFDVARSYGWGEAEGLLGGVGKARAARGLPRPRVRLLRALAQRAPSRVLPVAPDPRALRARLRALPASRPWPDPAWLRRVQFDIPDRVGLRAQPGAA